MPDPDQGAVLWLRKTARQNYWRVSTWYDLDDLVQDGYWHWYRITSKYPRVVARAQLMRLFQITYINHIHDLAKNRTRSQEILVSDLGVEALWDWLGVEADTGAFSIMVANAPAPIRAVLSLFNSEKCFSLRPLFRVRRNGERETVNERWCRLTGYDHHQIDLVHEVASYFAI